MTGRNLSYKFSTRDRAEGAETYAFPYTSSVESNCTLKKPKLPMSFRKSLLQFTKLHLPNNALLQSLFSDQEKRK